LLHGESKAGKSRTLTEAVKHSHSSSELIIPRDVAAVGELARIEPPLPIKTQPAILWLDNLAAADLEQLTAAVLEFWQRHAILVATMTTANYNAVMRTGSGVGAGARAALARASMYRLPFALSSTEIATAHELYPDENAFSENDELHQVSIGETLVGGEELIHKLQAGAEDNPAGQALVRIAVDVRRAGLRRPITTRILKYLLPHYLRHATTTSVPVDEQFAAGLVWATKPVTSQVSLPSTSRIG
jgi:hypothetical protein